MKIYYYLLVMGFGLVVALPVLAVFDRNLQVGSVGGDVALLQQVLNADPDTLITRVGVGSPGQESVIFGALTKQAVIKFQEKYSSEILTPYGLSSGTGFVGAATRAVLTRLYMKSNPNLSIGNPFYSVDLSLAVPPPPPSIETMNSAESLDVSTKPLVSNQDVLPKELLEALKKSGVSEKEYRERNAPNSSSLKISSINPTRGGVGTKVTIVGSGFSTSAGQDIYVGPDVIKNVKSKDGKTLYVIISNPYPSSAEGETISFNPGSYPFSTPIGIWVRDTTGVSNPVVFTLEL